MSHIHSLTLTLKRTHSLTLTFTFKHKYQPAVVALAKPTQLEWKKAEVHSEVTTKDPPANEMRPRIIKSTAKLSIVAAYIYICVYTYVYIGNETSDY